MNETDLTVSAKEIVPSLKSSRQKGDGGVIAVFGGHRAYVGSTYFSASGALKVGSDVVYIFTSKEAEEVKIISPDFIVYPIINDEKFMEECAQWLERIDVVVIGPGFRREKKYFHLFANVVETCRILKKGLVIDSSALNHLSKNMELIKNYPEPGVILTPNAEEVGILFGNVQADYSKVIGNLGKTITILRKGPVDEAINFAKTVKFTGGGSNRRGMGQGDLLAGVVGAFFGFAIKSDLSKSVDQGDLAIAACQGASKLVRECNARAFAKKGRAMVLDSITTQLNNRFVALNCVVEDFGLLNGRVISQTDTTELKKMAIDLAIKYNTDLASYEFALEIESLNFK
ncbi:hypothetical protein RN001_009847 [Aquatica leii]|uniref:ATP-dependent (S)-NAD(P)H-hydrate dehydratase n=1 Tax=Aquatica leii TaxID=1421715 RepID=A0AAN7P990_9COLE|nr:hypothetical protein RN001_009847 [Aquatica leii]